MNLEEELRQLFAGAADAPWPGERRAYDRFLRRRARRGRAVAAGTALGLVVLLAAVLLARGLPGDRRPEFGAGGGTVRLPDGGFQLPIPAGWKQGSLIADTSTGRPVGVALVPESGAREGITVAADESGSPVRGTAARRPDGRVYVLRPGIGPGEAGQYAVVWPNYSCGTPAACGLRARARVLLVTGSAAPGDAAGRRRVLQVMRQVVLAVRPIGNALRPPPPPTVPGRTKVLLGTGGSGAASWEAWIEPFRGEHNAGFSIHFPHATPKASFHWEQLEPSYLQRDGAYTIMDCLTWLPGSGLLLSGLAREDAASVRIELAGRAPVVVPTFGRDQPVPWVAFVSPRLPVRSRLDRVVPLDAAGKAIGAEERPFEGATLCR
jgi:hypothetical protein